MRSVATARGAEIASPWFTAEEAAAYLRIQSANGSLHAFYLAYRRLGIPAYRLRGGRELRFHQDDLDRALETARVERRPEPDVERKLALRGKASHSERKVLGRPRREAQA